VIYDGIVIRAADVRFDLLWRRNGADTLLGTWDEHFEPLPNGEYTAQAYERDVTTTTAIETQSGDELIFRYSGLGSTAMQAYIPNGDGAVTHGRIPNIRLPR
jgi:hypothetical protein